MQRQLLVFALLGLAPAASTAQEINTNALSENGWFSDDTRADGSGTEVAGTDLISDTLTDDPEASASGTAAHDSDIQGQIQFGGAPGTVPAGTFAGAMHLLIDGGGAGKSQISHRKDDGVGHGTGDGFGPGFSAEYSWMGDGTPTVTASLKFGVQTAEFGSTGGSSRTGESAWDKVLIYEPGNNGKTSDGAWHTETIDHTTGLWWFFDRTEGAGTIGTPLTLADMASSAVVVGDGPNTIADVYALITDPGTLITSVQFGVGSGNAGASVYVNQMETSVYRAGMTTTFGCDDTFYANGFEDDDFGWNVFGTGFASSRVPSGTNGVTSASGAFHSETTEGAAGNWGGYSGVCGCASSGCSGPVSTFPTGGYVTSIDIYLDVDGGFANDTRFDFSSAINDTTGVHRRDFIFNGAFLDSSEVTSVGAGTDRFVLAASNNSPGFPQGGVDPIAITDSGWYTFEHYFHDNGFGALACDFTIRDADGDEIVTWTRSDASDVIGSTVGGNRYGWFSTNDFPFLAFDNASRQPSSFDQNVTPDTIFGSGNTNGSFTVDREDGVEIGIRAKLRFNSSGVPENTFNSNGDGTYTYSVGSGGSTPPNAEWGYDWSVNTDYDDSTGLFFGDLDYQIGLDFDPSAGTDFLVFDVGAAPTTIPYTTPHVQPFWDHSMGTNATPNGGGAEASDLATFNALKAANNVAQNSWRHTFFDEAPFAFDPDVPGRYDLFLAAFDGSGDEVARSSIAVFAMDGLTLSLEGDLCQTDQDPGTAGVQIAVDLWLRNPDDEDVTGYQAFLAFDDGAMTYVGSSSSYSPAPFDIHIQDVATAEVAPGELRLDGNSFTGADGDALLATLVFTVVECSSNSLAFDLSQPFDSETSILGAPLATDLLDSPSILADDTAPVLVGTPANITQPADAGSCTEAVVTYAAPTATDNCDPAPVVVCSPPSGSAFPVGTTTVTCTATDECGNESVSTFDVTVTATNAVDVTVELTGSDPTSRCILFLADCGASADVTLSFSGTAPAVATATIEIPCGVYTKLCAKDQQHTKWDDTTLTIVGNKYVADTNLVLDGGDTDDDGDVDINDVTLYLSQFGALTASGGCPWDGTTRDADFSNDGAVGAEDYSFLVANWLTTSACSCAASPDRTNRRGLGRWKPVVDEATAAIDFNRDGRIDYRDVELFEVQFGLSGELSERMRASE